MATDHFKKHGYQTGRNDWNFNILVGKQPEVARMAQEYASTLAAQDGLYDPIPPEWLHMTVLRVGFVDDYSSDDMMSVANVLVPKLARIQLPELIFDGWWQWGGNIVFHISPDDALNKVYEAVIESLHEVVGEDRTNVTPHGHFIPHVTFAYAKDHHNELHITEALSKLHVKPARFYAPSLALIKQWPTNGHYEWEVVHELSIGEEH